MRCEFLLAADYAIVGMDGKASVCGIFDVIQAIRFPTTMEPFFIAVGLRLGAEDAGALHRIVARILDPDAVVLAELALELETGPGPSGSLLPLVRKTPPIPLSKIGRHELRLEIDGQAVAEHPITVVRCDEA